MIFCKCAQRHQESYTFGHAFDAYLLGFLNVNVSALAGCSIEYCLLDSKFSAVDSNILRICRID
jgi:hypothetical protein